MLFFDIQIKKFNFFAGNLKSRFSNAKQTLTVLFFFGFRDWIHLTTAMGWNYMAILLISLALTVKAAEWNHDGEFRIFKNLNLWFC